MASKEAERYWQSLCENVGTAINEFSKYSLMEAFDAGVASVPNNIELVDELQALREEMKLLKEKSEWHDLEIDPNDLPEKTGWYWCKYETGSYGKEPYTGWGNDFKNVVAWRNMPEYEGKARRIRHKRKSKLIV